MKLFIQEVQMDIKQGILYKYQRFSTMRITNKKFFYICVVPSFPFKRKYNVPATTKEMESTIGCTHMHP